jgi:hypothetical protein
VTVEGSRRSKEEAGWRPGAAAKPRWRARVEALEERRWTEFSWLTVRSLLDSANDLIAKSLDDLVNARRMRWVSTMRRAPVPGWTDLRGGLGPNDGFSFLVLGDPGEADGSQYAVVEAMRGPADGTSFMLVMSDVIYPAGDVNDYVNGYYEAFNEYRAGGPGDAPRPVLAVPGNHDWYDGLEGFMFHFCDAEPLPPTEYRATSFTVAERAARALWRRASRPNRPRIVAHRDAILDDDDAPPRPAQPGPYFAIDTERLMIVCIDTGITGALDAEQGRWLLRVSAVPKDKVLVTGKPLIVNGRHEPGVIRWNEDREAAGDTVDDIVRDPRHRYVAAMGGDVHNYQRYRVQLAPRPLAHRDPPLSEIAYIVAGGSGAFLSATHSFKKVDCALPDGPHLGEDDLVACYPSRGDSAAYYARGYMKTIRRWCIASLVPLVAWAVALGIYGLHEPVDPAAVDWRRLGDIALVSALSVLGFAGIALGAGFAGGAMPRGYRFMTTVGLLAGGLALVIAGLAGWWSNWDRVWPVIPIALAALLVPLAITIGAYFTRGTGPRFTGDLLVSATIVALAAVFLGPDARDWPGVVAIAGVGTLAVVIVVLVLQALLDWPKLGPLRTNKWFRRLVSGGIVVAVSFAVRAIDHWLVWSAVIAFGTILLIPVAVLWLVLVRPLGIAALVASIGGSADADAMYKLVAERFGRTADLQTPRATGARQPGWRTKLLAYFIVGRPGPWWWWGRWAQRIKVSEIGDGNEPPMFKSFLRLDVADAGLRIRCYGVTGWDEAPPCEDEVVIPLAPPGP